MVETRKKNVLRKIPAKNAQKKKEKKIVKKIKTANRKRVFGYNQGSKSVYNEIDDRHFDFRRSKKSKITSPSGA